MRTYILSLGSFLVTAHHVNDSVTIKLIKNSNYLDKIHVLRYDVLEEDFQFYHYTEAMRFKCGLVLDLNPILCRQIFKKWLLYSKSMERLPNDLLYCIIRYLY
jgi:hypothetical protein